MGGHVCMAKNHENMEETSTVKNEQQNYTLGSRAVRMKFSKQVNLISPEDQGWLIQEVEVLKW